MEDKESRLNHFIPNQGTQNSPNKHAKLEDGNIMLSISYDEWTIIYTWLDFYSIESLRLVCTLCAKWIKKYFSNGTFEYYEKSIDECLIKDFETKLKTLNCNLVISKLVREYKAVMVGEYVLHAIDTPVHFNKNKVKFNMNLPGRRDMYHMINYFKKYKEMGDNIEIDSFIINKSMEVCLVRFSIKLKNKLLLIIDITIMFGNVENIYPTCLKRKPNYERCYYDGSTIYIENLEDMLRGRVILNKSAATYLNQSIMAHEIIHKVGRRMKRYNTIGCHVYFDGEKVIKNGDKFMLLNE